MPSPTLVKTLAFAKFQGYRITLPAGASVAPGGLKLVTRSPARSGPTLGVKVSPGAMRSGIAMGTHRATGGGVQPAQGNPMSCPPALFVEGSKSVADVNVQKNMHDNYSKLLEDLAEAVRYGWDMFRLQAKFRNIKIMAVSAIGTPGCLDGPSTEPLIKSAPNVATYVGPWAEVRNAVAAGFANSFTGWASAVTVPGLPWYPTFAAFPAPVAPPVPNVPTPLVACVSARIAEMEPNKLKDSLAQKLNGKLDYHSQFADALAAMISPAFFNWLPMQMVSLVMGKGPIPSFAPPYVPVGPVVDGDVLSIPGHIKS